MAEYLNCHQLEDMTGTPAATWRYWAARGEGPASVKIGRRRVWKVTVVREWLDSLESVSV